MKIDRDFIFLAIGRILQAVIALVGLRVMTTYLPPQELGIVYLILSILTYFSLVLVNPVGMYVNRHLHEWKNKNQINAALKYLNRYLVLVVGFGLLILFLGKYIFDTDSGISYPLLGVVFVLQIYFGTWVQTYIPSLNLFGFRKDFVILNLILQALGLLLSFLFLFSIGNVAISWIFGLGLSNLIMFAVGRFVFHKRLTDQDKLLESKNVYSRDTFNFVWPMMVVTLLMWYQTQGYRLFVEKIGGVSALAQIGVGLGVAASLMSVLESVVSQYLQPEFYQGMLQTGIKDRIYNWEKYFTRSINVYIPISFLFCGLSPFILKLLVNERYHSLWWIVCVAVIIEFCRIVSNLLNSISHSEKDPLKSVIPYLLSCLVISLGLYVSLVNANYSQIIIVGSLFVGSLVSVKFLYFKMKTIFHFKVNLVKLFKIMLISSPLLIPLFWTSEGQVITSLFIAVISGAYCLFILRTVVQLTESEIKT